MMETIVLSMRGSAPRMRRLRQRRKLELIARLGGICCDCGEDDPNELEADHVDAREWASKDKWSDVRLRIYLTEAAAGKLELRRRSCNASKGQPYRPEHANPE